MKNTMILAVTFLMALILPECGQMLCGSLDEDLKERIDSVNSKYGINARVEHIPCEGRYVRLNLKSQDTQSVSLNAIHSILYDSINHKGWATILVYDNKNNYLFSHSGSGRIFKQTGD